MSSGEIEPAYIRLSVRQKNPKVTTYWRDGLPELIKNSLSRRGGTDLVRRFIDGQFGHLLCWRKGKSSIIALHQLMCYEVQAPPGEARFHISGREIRFSQYEYALVTGLFFGASTFDRTAARAPEESGVYMRVTKGNPVTGGELLNLWKNDKLGNLSEDDYLKVANVLALMCFFFAPADTKKVETWMWVLADDIDAWNDFPWGAYTYNALLHYMSFVPKEVEAVKSKYNIYGPVWALQIWAYEAIPDLASLCVRLINDGGMPRCVKWVFVTPPDTEWITFFALPMDTPPFETLTPTPEEQLSEYWRRVIGENPIGVEFPRPTTVHRRRVIGENPIHEEGSVPDPPPVAQKKKSKKKRAPAEGQSSGPRRDEDWSLPTYEGMIRSIDERFQQRETELLEKVDQRWKENEEKFFKKVGKLIKSIFGGKGKDKSKGIRSSSSWDVEEISNELDEETSAPSEPPRGRMVNVHEWPSWNEVGEQPQRDVEDTTSGDANPWDVAARMGNRRVDMGRHSMYEDRNVWVPRRWEPLPYTAPRSPPLVQQHQSVVDDLFDTQHVQQVYHSQPSEQTIVQSSEPILERLPNPSGAPRMFDPADALRRDFEKFMGMKISANVTVSQHNLSHGFFKNLLDPKYDMGHAMIDLYICYLRQRLHFKERDVLCTPDSRYTVIATTSVFTSLHSAWTSNIVEPDNDFHERYEVNYCDWIPNQGLMDAVFGADTAFGDDRIPWFDAKFVIFPVLAASHWMAVRLCIESWKLELYDSLNCRGDKDIYEYRKEVLRPLRKLIGRLLDATNYWTMNKYHLTHPGIRTPELVLMPQKEQFKQEDSHSCGPYTCMAIERLITGYPTPKWGNLKSNVRVYREWMAWKCFEQCHYGDFGSSSPNE